MTRAVSHKTGQVVVLAGGVGAARFLEGLVQVVPPEEVFAVVNVGDDLEIAGLHVAPDIDTVLYTLAGRGDPETGWGLQGDTFHTFDALHSLSHEAWFRLGDRDLATHLYRTQRLREGVALSRVTAEIASALGVRARVTPVTDQRLRTMVQTEAGELAFQEYFVRRSQRDRVMGLRFDGAEAAEAAPGVHAAILNARALVIAPSNPFLSIGPILAVPALRDCVLTTAAPVAAVSPIVGGRALKGPAAAILESLGHAVSALGVARLYQDLADVLVIDEEDRALAPQIEAETELRCVVTPSVMHGPAEKRALAQMTLDALAAVVP